MPNDITHILALDIGDRRVGVAAASLKTLIAKPLITLSNDEMLIQKLKDHISEFKVETLVVGLPRTLSGSDTAQTNKTREVVKQLVNELPIKIVTQDEALSSVRAEQELRDHGKMFKREDIDKLAACLILEDYIKDSSL